MQTEARAQLRCLGRVESERHRQGAVPSAPRYAIASSPTEVTLFAPAVRAPWGIEQCVHWVLAVACRADESRGRRGQAPANLAVLRPSALNLLRQDTRTKLGIPNKRLTAGWEDAYLANLVLGHAF